MRKRVLVIVVVVVVVVAVEVGETVDFVFLFARQIQGLNHFVPYNLRMQSARHSAETTTNNRGLTTSPGTAQSL